MVNNGKQAPTTMPRKIFQLFTIRDNSTKCISICKYVYDNRVNNVNNLHTHTHTQIQR